MNKTKAYAPVTDKYLSGYTFSEETGTDSYLKENELFMGAIFMWDDFMKSTVMLNFGESVKNIMKRQGITQEQLAFDLDVDREVHLESIWTQTSSSRWLMLWASVLH